MGSNGRAWATLGFLLGILVSIAGNVAHTWHPSAEQLAAAGLTLQQVEQWKPAAGAQLFAAFFPAALLVTVEVLARVAWPRGWGWSAARFVGAGLVALVAAVVSYLHLSGLLTAYGEDRLTALIGPLAVDGLMVVCGFALLAIGRLKSVERLDEGPVGGAVEDVEAVEQAPEIVEDTPENGAEDGREFGRPSETSGPAQAVVVDVPSAVIAARAAGLSLQRIADEFGVTKYRVEKILKAVEPASS